MSHLMNVGYCCLLLSIWGVVQLAIMGVFYMIEATVLIEDVIAIQSTDYNDFIQQTKSNFNANAINCWIAAVIYALMIVISCVCLKKAKMKAKRDAEKLEDDELACGPMDFY